MDGGPSTGPFHGTSVVHKLFYNHLLPPVFTDDRVPKRCCQSRLQTRGRRSKDERNDYVCQDRRNKTHYKSVVELNLRFTRIVCHRLNYLSDDSDPWFCFLLFFFFPSQLLFCSSPFTYDVSFYSS